MRPLEEMLAMPDERRDSGGGEGAMRTPAAGEGEEGSAPSPPPKKKLNLADLLGKRKAQSSNPVPKRIRADTEVARYLQEEALDLHSDPLAWWRDNQA